MVSDRAAPMTALAPLYPFPLNQRMWSKYALLVVEKATVVSLFLFRDCSKTRHFSLNFHRACQCVGSQAFQFRFRRQVLFLALILFSIPLHAPST